MVTKVVRKFLNKGKLEVLVSSFVSGRSFRLTIKFTTLHLDTRRRIVVQLSKVPEESYFTYVKENGVDYFYFNSKH